MFDPALFTHNPAARPGAQAMVLVHGACHHPVASNRLLTLRQVFAPPGAARD